MAAAVDRLGRFGNGDIFQPDTVVRHGKLVPCVTHDCAIPVGYDPVNTVASSLPCRLGSPNSCAYRLDLAGGARGVFAVDFSADIHFYTDYRFRRNMGRVWWLVFFFLPCLFVLTVAGFQQVAEPLPDILWQRAE